MQCRPKAFWSPVQNLAGPRTTLLVLFRLRNYTITSDIIQSRIAYEKKLDDFFS